LFRDKVAIFFVFIFPLIFLFVFGSLFGGNNEVSFKVAILNQSQTEFATLFVEEAKQNEVFDIDEKITTLDQAKEKMNRSEISATLILPENFGEITNGQYPGGEATVLYDQNNEQAGQTLKAVLEGAFKEINSQFVQNQTPFT